MSYIGHSDKRPYTDTAKDKKDLEDVLNFKEKFEENFGSLSSQIFTEVVFRNVKGQTSFPVTVNPKTVEVELNGIRLVKCPDNDTVFANGDFTATSGLITLAQPIAKDDYTLTVRSEGLSIQQQYSIIEQVPVGTSMLWFSDKAIPIGYIAMLGQAPADIQQYPDLLKLFPVGLPNTEHDFIRGAGPNRAVMTRQSDAIRNITGHAATVSNQPGGSNVSNWGPWESATGVFKLGQNVTSYRSTNGIAESRPGSVLFDASFVVPTADENRPRNLSAFYIVKAFSTLQNGGYKDVSEQLKQLYELSLSKSASSVPAGITAMWSSAEPIPAGWLPLWGQTKEELSMYPAAVRLYPNGMPDTRLQFVRGADGTTRMVGSLQNDAARPITGSFQGCETTSENGAFYAGVQSGSMSTGPTPRRIFHFDSTRSNPNNTAEENRPKNIAFFYIVKIYDYATIPEVADFTYVVQQLKPKLDRLRFSNSWISEDGLTYWVKQPLQDGKTLLIQGGLYTLPLQASLPLTHKINVVFPIAHTGIVDSDKFGFPMIRLTGSCGVNTLSHDSTTWTDQQFVSFAIPSTTAFDVSVTVTTSPANGRRFVWRSEAIING